RKASPEEQLAAVGSGDLAGLTTKLQPRQGGSARLFPVRRLAARVQGGQEAGIDAVQFPRGRQRRLTFWRYCLRIKFFRFAAFLPAATTAAVLGRPACNDPSTGSVEGGGRGRRNGKAFGRPACTGQVYSERGFLQDNRQSQAAFVLLKRYGRRQAARPAGNT